MTIYVSTGAFLVSLGHRNPTKKVISFALQITPRRLDGYNHESASATMPRTPIQIYSQYGNINPLSIVYATRLDLGPTNPGTITVAQETLLFRRAGFSPAL
jgi:hypothetical protein